MCLKEIGLREYDHNHSMFSSQHNWGVGVLDELVMNTRVFAVIMLKIFI